MPGLISLRQAVCIFFVIFVRMKQLFLTLLAAASLSNLSAQEGTIFTPDAKSMSMGGLSTTLTGASHTLYHNVAMSGFSTSPIQLSSSFYKQGDCDFYAVSGSAQLREENRIHAGWRQYLRGTGNRDGAVDVGYVRRIGSEWSIGVVARYLHLTRPEGNANALAADLAVAWAHPLEHVGSFAMLRFGAKLANLGSYLNRTDYKLPASGTAGVALDTYLSDAHEVTVGVDLGYCFTPAPVRGFSGSVGAEYNLMQLVQIRAGYHYGDSDTYLPSYTSVGAGVRFLHLRLDFAYLFAKKSSPLRNTYSFSFGLDF